MSCALGPASTSETGSSDKASWSRLKLSKELESAVQDDARRKAIDAAKKRAVSQHVDYETFQAMVSVAHLKPIERDEWLQKPIELRGSPAWRLSPDGSFGDNEQSTAGGVGASIAKQTANHSALPASAEDFYKQWKSMTGHDSNRLRFLLSIPPGKLQQLFKVEIRPALLEEIFVLLNKCWPFLGHLEEARFKDSLTEAVSHLRLEKEPVGETGRQAVSSGAASSDQGPVSAVYEENDLELEKSGAARDLGNDKEGPIGLSEQGRAPLINEKQGGNQVGIDRHQTGADGSCLEVDGLMKTLDALANSGRFALTVRLVGGAHRKGMKLFFDKLKTALEGDPPSVYLDRLNALRAQFAAY